LKNWERNRLAAQSSRPRLSAALKFNRFMLYLKNQTGAVPPKKFLRVYWYMKQENSHKLGYMIIDHQAAHLVCSDDSFDVARLLVAGNEADAHPVC